MVLRRPHKMQNMSSVSVLSALSSSTFEIERSPDGNNVREYVFSSYLVVDRRSATADRSALLFVRINGSVAVFHERRTYLGQATVWNFSLNSKKTFIGKGNWINQDVRSEIKAGSCKPRDVRIKYVLENV